LPGAAHAELAEALRFQRVRFVVEIGQEHRIDVHDIGVSRHMIAGQVVIDEPGLAFVDATFFVERPAERSDHAADYLGPRGSGVEDAAAGENAEHAAQARFAGIDVHGDSAND